MENVIRATIARSMKKKIQRKTRKFQENLKTPHNSHLVPSLLPKMKTLSLIIKIQDELDLSCSSLFYR